MRGQWRRLSRDYQRGQGGNVIVYVLISFHSRNVLCALSRAFVRPCFRLFCPRLAVKAISALLRQLVHWLCNGVLYNSLFTSFLLFTKGRLSKALLPLLLKLFFAAWAANAFLHIRPSVCSVA